MAKRIHTIPVKYGVIEFLYGRKHICWNKLLNNALYISAYEYIFLYFGHSFTLNKLMFYNVRKSEVLWKNISNASILQIFLKKYSTRFSFESYFRTIKMKTISNSRESVTFIISGLCNVTDYGGIPY